MKISYAITVCNEHKELDKLLSFLFEHKRKEDEVIVQRDNGNATEEVWDVCERFESKRALEYKHCSHALNKNFAQYKNNLNKQCSGDWIFQIDADEIPNEYLIQSLPYILEANPDTEAYWVPRVNTVAGITESHIQKWGWRVDEKGWVNFPDYQWRIYKNNGKIKWKNKVHEVLEGYKTLTALPAEEIYCLIHEKTIERQEKQNNYYNTL